MPYLKWIEDQELISCVKYLLDKAKEAKANTNFGKNVIDPFSAVFEISGFGIGYDEWVESEITRQAQKTLQNHIGNFHQNVLGSAKGWENKRTGSVIDLVCEEGKMLAEIKNKHNTVTGGKLADLYKTIENQVMPKSSIYRGYTGYYVVVLPKRPVRYDVEFMPSDKEKGAKCQRNALIREIDGASFYTMVTGDHNALEDLFRVLPQVIADITGGDVDDSELNRLGIFFDAAFGSA